jgi:hypothetical protein
MMRSFFHRLMLWFAVGLVSMSGVDAWAGWHYQENITFYNKQKVLSREKATIYWQGMKLRRENSDGSVYILNLDKDTYYEVEPAFKTYRQSALVPVVKGSGSLPRELDEALAQLSPEERQLLEQYLPSKSAIQEADLAKVVPGTETEVISGYSCQKIKARYRNLQATLWVTSEVTISPEEHGFFRELAKRTLHREGMEDWYLWAEVLAQLGGFAIKQEQLLESAAGNLKSIIVVDKIAEEAIDEGLFQVPKGYSPQDE